VSEPRYRRLPGKGRQFSGTDLLLVGDDHLLLASRQMYVETYQRFYFADIQAITLRASSAREITTSVLIALLLLLVAAFWFSDSMGFRIFWGTVAIGTLFASSINWLRGPGVHCHLTTALQTVELTPLNRRPRAERLLGEIAARVRTAQAELPALPYDESTAPEEEPLATTRAMAQTPTPAGARLRSKPPPLPAVYSGLWHWLLFSLLLVDSAVTYWSLQTDALSVAFVGGTLSIVVFGVALAALIRQRALVVARPVKALAWTAMSFMLVLLVAGWFFGMYIGIASAFQPTSDPLVMFDPAAAQLRAEPLSWFSLVGTTAIGLAGLAVMSAGRRRPRASDLG
jgi:hypothetical protein